VREREEEDMHTCIRTYIYIYIHTYIQRVRERERRGRWKEGEWGGWWTRASVEKQLGNGSQFLEK
jgi:hypothetical protein